MKTNGIGLEQKKAKELAQQLNKLLASYHIFYQNLRGFHWNIRGALFFELHIKFEEYYTDALLKIDEIAERILTLEATPYHSFQSFIKHSDIQTTEGLTDGVEMVKTVLSNLKQLIITEREIVSFAQSIGDEATAGLVSTYISEQEKTVWMLAAYSAK